ncbi:MAG: metal-dependent hydrolase [Blastocatellia bacterium]
MDNITHSLVGLTLAETGLKRATPLGTATLVLAANFPDIDIVTGLFGNLYYLEHHRGITHAVAVVPLLSLVLAALIYGWSRWQRGGARFGPLCGLSLLGMATHPLLDFLNSYGWRPFLPWNERWFYGDIAFVIDPWLWVLLGGAMFFITARTKPQLMLQSAVLLLMVAVIGSSHQTSLVIRLMWLALAGCAVWLRFAFSAQERTARAISISVLAAMCLYLGMLAWLHQVALHRTGELAVAAQARDSGAQVQTSALPTPANPLRWQAVIATEQAYYLTDLSLTSPTPGFDSLARYARESGDSSVIAAARRTAQAQTFLHFARFPVSEVLTDQGSSSAEVEIRDVRFQHQGVSNTFRTLIRLDKNLSPLMERRSH